MQPRHFPEKLIRMLQATMNAVPDESIELVSEPFESHRGLRQGDGLFSLLFNIALEGVI